MCVMSSVHSVTVCHKMTSTYNVPSSMLTWMNEYTECAIIYADMDE